MTFQNKELATYIIEAIKSNYLICIIVTSYTQAKHKTTNLPFGLGKTTLALDLSYLLNGFDWNTVFENLVYNPYDLAVKLKPGNKRVRCVVWDDVQFTAPARAGVPKAIVELANFISTERPEVACIVFTSPNVNSISAPLRKLVNFEIIVSERGFSETHKIRYYKDFNRPLQDRSHLDYVDEIPQDEPFPPLSEANQKRYDNWRIEQKLKLFPNLLSDLDAYVKMNQWATTENIETTVMGDVIKTGGGYAVTIPEALGKQLHHRKIAMDVKQTT